MDEYIFRFLINGNLLYQVNGTRKNIEKLASSEIASLSDAGEDYKVVKTDRMVSVIALFQDPRDIETYCHEFTFDKPWKEYDSSTYEDM